MHLIEQRLREQRGLTVLLLVAAFSFSAIATAAFAAHFHAYACDGNCSVGHGLVHGSSTTDGSFFSRVDAHTSPWDYGSQDCWVYQQITLIDHTVGAFGGGCNTWSGGTGLWNETQGRAKTRSWSGNAGFATIPEHTHTAH